MHPEWTVAEVSSRLRRLRDPGSEVVAEVFEAVFEAGGDKEGVAGAEGVAVGLLRAGLDGEGAGAPRNDLDLVLLMGLLGVLADGGTCRGA